MRLGFTVVRFKAHGSRAFVLVCEIIWSTNHMPLASYPALTRLLACSFTSPVIRASASPHLSTKFSVSRFISNLQSSCQSSRTGVVYTATGAAFISPHLVAVSFRPPLEHTAPRISVTLDLLCGHARVLLGIWPSLPRSLTYHELFPSSAQALSPRTYRDDRSQLETERGEIRQRPVQSGF